ncbi:hypothetical protein H663_010545 [Limnohabitans planktonicus II-D5]|uniref:Uncharacterized protein n=1 Tax=Limnohabitans planktonicus II-D5 TaxID=1293045 RepID=A0A2T7UDE6_9BURK|nr:hypothetical protein H663_010545 [Limnohabitans planktonicus II-D5]
MGFRLSALRKKFKLSVFLQDGQREFGQTVADDRMLGVAAIKALTRTLRMECIPGVLKPCAVTWMGDNP